ncbi:hypothetical protein OF897_21385, partial [Chryseobacterium formosus]
QNKYNELSQLESKKVGGVSLGNGLQQVDYLYNIRGWMTQINNPNDLSNGDLFGYKIKYNQVEGQQTPNNDFLSLEVKPKFSGNIAEVDWSTATTSGDYLRRYGYVYDGLNRLKAGFYQRDDNPTAKEYFEKMDYDLNGNITNLKRSAQKDGNTYATIIDNLTYSYNYQISGNRLNSVTDSSTDYRGYPDTSGNTITYDLNGNMKKHEDKGILQINYNMLNLPNYIKFNQSIASRGGARYVNTVYTYNAAGNKVKKVYQYKEGNILFLATKTTDYLDGFQYETDATLSNPMASVELKFIPTAEGYFDFVKNKYIYNYADHLGNTRLSYFHNGSSIEVLEENNYYPFGLKHEGYNALAGNPSYQYKYNGKELQTETGMYDYGARFYMPDIGRWGVVDPLAEMYQPMSTYHMSGNNPVFYVDSNGMNYDDYGMDNNGNTSLIQKTDDKFDRLYKAKSDSKGNAIKDAKGNAQKATEGVGKENQDYVKVNKETKDSGSIISQLSIKDSEGLSHGTTTNSVDARRVFQFAADNSKVEWSIGGFDTKGTGMADKYLVGTAHLSDRVRVVWQFGEQGLTYENLKYNGHTHPNSRMPKQHDNDISKPGIYNFIYYTGVGNGIRENYFVPYHLETNTKTGINKATMKSNYRQVKLPDLIP